MIIFAQQTLLLLKRLLLVWGMFVAGRLYFYLHNLEYFTSAWPHEVIKSFFYGVHFDVSALIYFNLPLIILHLLPGNFATSRLNEKIMKYYFFVINGLLMFSNFMDAEYFRFTGKRTTSDIFSFIGMSEDIYYLIPRFVYDYWYIILIWLLIMFLVWSLYPEASRVTSEKRTVTLKKIAAHTLMLLLALTFFISLARGYRLKPLRVISATNYVSAGNIPLILNTPFTIMKSFNKERIKVPEYFSMEEAEYHFSPIHQLSGTNTRNKLNVVLIIMESFSKEFSGYLTGTKGYMPFLDSLMQESLNFPNAFANGKKSLEALPAILSSIPALTETPFVSSPYSSNPVHSLSGQLSRHNYHSSFFHGGINGTMGFDNFSRLAGIDHYFGKTEFNDDKYYDGNWGIYDEEFFQYFAGNLNTFPEPFFSCFFSLSSHHPYTIPEKHRGRFPKGEHQIHESIAYSDYSLKRFFETIRDDPWFENTLFIITADHTARSLSSYYQNRIGDYAIPILYYHPGNPDLRRTDNRLTQHIDIMPSVLDYIDIDDSFISFGRSVFSEQNDRFVINYLNKVFQYMEDDWVLFHDGEKSIGLYNFITDSLLQNNYLLLPDGTSQAVNKNHLENRLKSIIQQYNYRLVNNALKVE